MSPDTPKLAIAPGLAREQLPIPNPKHVGLTTYDAKDLGGPCSTPVADRLAANGIKLNRFRGGQVRRPAAR
ncbi:hypothetical protein [Mycolicibacterium vanbaalenii]|uniref:hypothetical protein n=1 Tax=Mycolicibacterium vanbaalenii TaxID=110539 RepID=UPI00190F871F|nr:hypothetical protein [Mycolicibacterium vanbaalenii]